MKPTRPDEVPLDKDWLAVRKFLEAEWAVANVPCESMSATLDAKAIAASQGSKLLNKRRQHG
jgi:hypothetical protein